MAKIIIIDDEQHVCDLLHKIFEPEGYVVQSITDPVAGVELVAKERPDCVLLDVKMPLMTGIEVLSRIKNIDKNIEVIMITAHGELDGAMECVRLGAYEYVAKPFELDYIRSLVKQCLRDKKK